MFESSVNYEGRSCYTALAGLPQVPLHFSHLIEQHQNPQVEFPKET